MKRYEQMTFPPSKDVPDTAAAFLAERAPWLSVVVVEVEPGGWDVFLAVDGTYAVKDDALAAAAVYAKTLEDMPDIPGVEFRRGWNPSDAILAAVDPSKLMGADL